MITYAIKVDTNNLGASFVYFESEKLSFDEAVKD